jgi:ketosteroid isomerase-like protein
VRVPRRGASIAIALLALTAQQAVGQTPSDDELAVSRVLDALHEAAAEADFDRYFGLYAEDAIFLGTDATERWTRADFMAYAKPYFDQGRGWTYTMTERHVSISDDGNTAWFDERLDNASLGECRGSGALVKVDGEWMVVQYNLTIPIPNALASDVVEQIRDHSTAPPSP